VKSNLFKRGFLALIITQFFGAANDNILKGVLTFMVIDGAWQGRLGAGGQGIVGLCFTVPFILLSGYGGQFADRYSKRSVSVWVKVCEIPIALIALLGLWAGELWTTLFALVLLTTQSTFFGPAKYGMIPELVPHDDLSRANGAINMMTNIAVIVGMLAAGFIADAYYPLPQPNMPTPEPVPWLPGAVMLIVAVAGLATVVFLTPLVPGDRSLKFNWNPFAIYIDALREMAKSPLLGVALAWGYFYFLAGLALLIIPEYTTVLGISREKASYLLGIMGVAIGAGSAAAGFISGHRIETRLVPVGALGMLVFFTLLGFAPTTFWVVGVFILCAGFFAGFYIIPLQALLQKLSPADERGRFLGTSNGISFAFLALASLVYWIIRPGFGSAPQRVFLVCAGLILLGALLFLRQLRRIIFQREQAVQ
jgi:acyl-[acyl-carrier-protein]-phospholipid O-acyltransferase/long-chain-fatty-acid--[acyl-carrier-protein] ligase